MRLARAAALLALAATGLARAAPPLAPLAAATPAATVFEMALPAKIALVAWLPAARGGLDGGAAVDLDLRVEVVMPMACGDCVAGLLRTGGASLDGPDAYEVVIERRALGACKKEPARIGARTAIRMRLADGQRRELTIGPQAYRIERQAGAVTLDGSPAEGDLPGAAPTARPTTLVVGEVTQATLLHAARDTTDPDSARALMRVAARWPACAGAPVGMLGRGDASTRFALTRFQPLALAHQDEPCGGKPIARSAGLGTVVRLARGADQAAITVGNVAMPIRVGTAALAGPAAR